MTPGHTPPPAPSDLADALKTALLLPTSPVGVRIFGERATFDSWPWPHPDVQLHYCTAVRLASEGNTLALDRSDIACDTAPRTLGLEPGFFEDEFIESYVTAGLYRDRRVADAVLSDVVALRKTAGVAVGPLDRFSASDPPDVVIVSTTPYGVMRIVQATAFHGHPVRSTTIGMHGICSENTAAPILTGEVSVSLMCSGARYEAGWDEQMMSVGLPYPLLAEVVEGLLDTAERYETDDRKDAMRAACRNRPPGAADIVCDLASLSKGTGYFVRE